MADEVLGERVKKVEELRARGIDPYGGRYETTHTLAGAREAWEAAGSPEGDAGSEVRVAGRVVAGDLRALERALHTRANATVPLTVYRFGQRLQVDAPVYDMTADRVQR